MKRSLTVRRRRIISGKRAINIKNKKEKKKRRNLFTHLSARPLNKEVIRSPTKTLQLCIFKSKLFPSERCKAGGSVCLWHPPRHGRVAHGFISLWSCSEHQFWLSAQVYPRRSLWLMSVFSGSESPSCYSLSCTHVENGRQTQVEMNQELPISQRYTVRRLLYIETRDNYRSEWQNGSFWEFSVTQGCSFSEFRKKIYQRQRRWNSYSRIVPKAFYSVDEFLAENRGTTI